MSDDSHRLKIMAAIVMILSLAGGGFYYYQWYKESKSNDIYNPQVNDVYRYVQEDGVYSAFKVIDVSDEGVVVYENTHSHPDEYGELPDSYFEGVEYEISFTREEFQSLLDEGEIYDVIRDDGFFGFF